MSTNLKLSPYFLDDEAIQWVEDTIANMTIEEKIGQLFVNLGKSTDEAYIKDLVTNYHIGGARYTEVSAEKIYEQNKP